MMFFLVLSSIQGLQKVPFDSLEKKIGIPKSNDKKLWNDFFYKMWDTGYFQGLELHQEQQKYFIKATEQAFIKTVEITGNDHVKNKEIQKILSSKNFRFFSEKNVFKDIEEIKKIYEMKGYFLADVSYKLEKLKKDYKLIFVIEENSKIKIRKITFSGNTLFSNSILEKELFSQKSTFLNSMGKRDQIIKEVLPVNESRILFFYATHGYIQAKITESYQTLSLDKKSVHLHYMINEGAQYFINNINLVEGFSSIPLKKGDIYNASVIRNYSEKVASSYKDKGYAEAQCLVDLKNLDNNKVDTFFLVEKGSLFNFGRVYITGNTHTRDYIILREMEFEEGALFNQSKLKESENNLKRLSFLDPQILEFSVKKSPKDDQSLDIHIKVKEKGNINIGLGLKYGMDKENGVFSISGEFSTDNLFGRAYVSKLSVDVLSRSLTEKAQQEDKMEYLKSASFLFFNPSIWNKPIGLQFNGSYTGEGFNDSFTFKKLVGSLGITWYFLKNYSLSFDLGYERFSLKQLYNNNLKEDDQEIHSPFLELGFQYKKFNNYRYTTKGFSFQSGLELKGIHDNSWGVLVFQQMFFYPAFEQVVYRQRLEYKQNIPLRGNVPVYYQHTLGGASSLRGYDINTFGHFQEGYHLKDQKNVSFNIGQQASFLASFELERPLIESIVYLSVFFDMGNVYEKAFNFSDKFFYDAGLGIKFFTPMGVIDFDIGFPLFNNNKKEPKLQFTIKQSLNAF